MPESRARDEYIRALRFGALTRIYDPLMTHLGRERAWKRALVETTSLAPGMQALDVGCGTGTLTMMLARSCPEASVVGLDGDGDALMLATRKLTAASLSNVTLVEGLAQSPPFAEGGFDRVVASLVVHHIPPDQRTGALRTLASLLRPGGRMHVAEWAPPRDLLMGAAFMSVRILDGFRTTADSVSGALTQRLCEAGLADVRQTASWRTAFGVVSLYAGDAPAR